MYRLDQHVIIDRDSTEGLDHGFIHGRREGREAEGEGGRVKGRTDRQTYQFVGEWRGWRLVVLVSAMSGGACGMVSRAVGAGVPCECTDLRRGDIHMAGRRASGEKELKYLAIAEASANKGTYTNLRQPTFGTPAALLWAGALHWRKGQTSKRANKQPNKEKDEDEGDENLQATFSDGASRWQRHAASSEGLEGLRAPFSMTGCHARVV